MKKIQCADNPCGSCPYRKDTPPGVWDESEYKKLSAWDGESFEQMNRAVFLCHSATTKEQEFACRGWLEVHSNNIGVRIAMTRIEFNRTPTTIPLYTSGRAACAAGLKGIRRLTRAARNVIAKLAEKKRREVKV